MNLATNKTCPQMKLNDNKCRTCQPRDKPYKLFDGAGLYLEIMPTGSKFWRLT